MTRTRSIRPGEQHRRPHSFRKPEGEPADPQRTGLICDPHTSARLRKIRRRNTSAEQFVRRMLHEAGLRFRVSNRDLPGSPDVANRSKRWCVFVHGCFWHHHAGCRRATLPKRNKAFWEVKFAANQARDARVRRQLEDRGYLVITVWECEIENPELLLGRMRRLSGYA